MAVARHLRYSPRNWLIVDWSASGRAFGNCGLPKPIPCLVGASSCGDACSHPLPIQEAIDTYDWERWLPEIIVGIDDPDEEIAANYAREAAIEFCKGARVLQRELVIELQPDTLAYPVFPYPEERIIGGIGVKTGDNSPCACDGSLTGSWYGRRWRLDTARNEFSLDRAPESGLLRILVWAAPTEAACVHDQFLYEHFRKEITLGARRAYAMAVHFRDRALMQFLPTAESFDRAIVLSKSKAMMLPSSWPSVFGSTFNSGRGQSPEDYYFHRS